MEIIYNKANDSLMILWAENKPAVNHDVDGEFWLRIVPDTNEIIGIEIEDFKAFSKKHARYDTHKVSKQ